jgi:hypothetical protein
MGTCVFVFVDEGGCRVSREESHRTLVIDPEERDIFHVFLYVNNIIGILRLF